jgi:hypothetical protein
MRPGGKITGTVIAAWRIRAKTPSPSRFGITRSRITQSIRRPIGAGKMRERRVAIVDHDGLIARLLHHVVQKPALHRIVVDDENGHFLCTPAARCSTLCRFGSLCGTRLMGC